MSLDEEITTNEGPAIDDATGIDNVIGVAIEPVEGDELVEELDPFGDDESQRVRRTWYFIFADSLLLFAWIGYYLYERSANLGGNWLSILGYNFDGLTKAQIQYTLIHVPPFRAIEAPVPGDPDWAIAGLVFLSALVICLGERRLHRRRAKFSKFGPFAVVASIIAGAATWMVVLQMRNIPQLFETHTQVPTYIHTAYGTAIVVLGVGLIIHLLLLIAAGFDLAVTSWTTKLMPHYLVTVRMTRMLWIWMAISVGVTSILIHSLY